MRALLLLNGPAGWQTGIEDGFNNLNKTGEISQLTFFYLEDFWRANGAHTVPALMKMVLEIQPDLIVLFHISTLPIIDSLITGLSDLEPRPILVYDEGDMYGTWVKPITKSMKKAITSSDVVSIRGLGAFQEQIHKLNKRIIYTPHHADIARFDHPPHILGQRRNNLVFVGNRTHGFRDLIKRLPGAEGRESLVRAMGASFANEFVLHGNGWGGFTGNKGPIDFQTQLAVYRDSWVTVAYEHYPDIPYYFSNRLPIALLAGSLYVCHYHEGYQHLFPNCDFIFFFHNNKEAVDIARYVLSLGKEDRLERCGRARAFALRHFHPNVVWRNFLHNVKNARSGMTE
jgi:hypothetical protein